MATETREGIITEKLKRSRFALRFGADFIKQMQGLLFREEGEAMGQKAIQAATVRRISRSGLEWLQLRPLPGSRKLVFLLNSY